ncbi:LamG-like jellyroll fold domain-containing protein [Marinilabilia rubra]|uniref:LamG-like jellyroll fold domain-containing protein n=1 Tax=Marinilabilia rubra TaxID=2162893 RepID=A0A2U2B628_9BACT|nr:LamG-like jellyroll fold domain-containing protein [Marinilabilia rubra]PWD98531.1 hypothetical protein DDZ16_14935 [Marinilabilia rubra]
MKAISKIIVFAFTLLLFSACEQDYIDGISKMDPGPDESAPQVTLNYPSEGTRIQVTEPTTTINIDFEVTDDIEIGTVTVSLDGSEIASFNEFKDYRRFLEEISYEGLGNGEHTLTITANDLEGKSTSVSVTFEKVPPYEAKFDGEIFYMPFNGDFMELMSQEMGTVVGSPGFVDEGISLQAYEGAADSYVSFPVDILNTGSFTAAFWYKVNPDPGNAGLFSISPSGEDRTKGLRFFREGDATEQRFKLNVGTGSSEIWNDGNVLDPSEDKWVHMAFTVSENATIIYFNGEPVHSTDGGVIDWTGCEGISIASGAPNFTYWGHGADQSLYDELRIFNKALSQEELKEVMADEGEVPPYEAQYEGETFYMPFDGSYEEKITETMASEVGNPGFAGESIEGINAYAGAVDSYLTYPTDGLTSNEFSAAFWYKCNPDPTNAGILVAGPEDTDNPDAQNVRTSGFRFFREGNATEMRFKLNVGTGDGEAWNDGGTIDPSVDEWVHLAFTISESKTAVYINGELALEGDTNPIDWTGCDIMSIMSGSPHFTGWNHLYDLSYMDELYLFNKALTAEQVASLMNDGM